jgi:glycosyltransferase involved in cell wall biosynthesis
MPCLLTVVIPTYNGGDRLPLVLEHLHQQVTDSPIDWEILIVDNNSDRATADRITDLIATWAGPVPLGRCHQPRQGLAYARQLAIETAQGDWVGFIDDDNWPAPTWVAEACRFIQTVGNDNPNLVAIGSRILGQYDRPLPDHFEGIKAFLAVRDQQEQRQFNPEQLQLPPGAGLVVHRQSWLDRVPTELSLAGRVGNLMVSGEDYAALIHLAQDGGEIWYNPAMEVGHCIPWQRLQRGYLLPLAYGIGLATCHLRWINRSPIGRVVIALRTFLGGLRRILELGWPDRPPLENLGYSFQLSYFAGMCISPLYALSPKLIAPMTYQRLRRLLPWSLFPSLFQLTTPPLPSSTPSLRS